MLFRARFRLSQHLFLAAYRCESVRVANWLLAAAERVRS